jgi:polyvinyl alcohol dehydrogenase (cytochrome)
MTFAIAACGVMTAVSASVAVAAAPSWTSGSQSILGNRSQPFESTINPGNVGTLKPKWVFTDHGDVSATPTVSNGAVYFPDFGGYLNAVKADNGHLIWQKQISAYDGQSGQVSRNSPLVVGNELILGDNASSNQPHGAHVFAVSRSDGKLLWSTQVDDNPAAIITSNAVNYGNEVVVGIASNEEADAERADYPCCSFRGAVVALDATTGNILWKTYMVPSSTGSTGDSNQPCTGGEPCRGMRLQRSRRLGDPDDRPVDAAGVHRHGQQLHGP